MKQVYWNLSSKDAIVRKPSAARVERDQWLQDKKKHGCDLCGGHSRLAWHPKDPETNDFNVQEAGLRISTAELEREMDKCVLMCVSCHNKVKGNRRPTAAIRNKELYWDLQSKYHAIEEAKNARFGGNRSL